MRWKVALLFVLLVSAGCLGTADESEAPPYGENATVAEIVEGHDENEVQGYRYTLSVRDAETGELRREHKTRIDYPDGRILFEENVIGEDVSRTTYINLSSGIRYVDRELGDAIYPEPQPEEVDADDAIGQHSLSGILDFPSANGTRLTLEDTEKGDIFRYSTESVNAEGTEVTNISMSATADGFIQGFSLTAKGLEYAAEVEDRGDIDVEKPDWVDMDGTTRSFDADISVEQESGEIKFVFVDVGNLDEARLVGPRGGASVNITADDWLWPGLSVVLSDGGFPEKEIGRNLVKPNDDECLIKHGANEVAGQTVGPGTDIPCDGSGIEELEGADIRYETGAEYFIIGFVDGEEAVIETVTTGQE